MAVEHTTGVQAGYSAYAANEAGKTDKTKKSEGNYGKTIGKPQLSEKAQKYYESLKKKYANYDFILVSQDEKAAAEANASKYAKAGRTVVLIDDEKIEKMASDENYRKKYEGILSGASQQLAKLKSSMEKSGANVQGYGMQVNDDGTASFFAVLKKSSADQKTRIEKGIAKKKAEKKAAEKQAAKKTQEERLKGGKTKRGKETDEVPEEDDSVVISANSMEELLQKIGDYMQDERMNSVQTDGEKMVGQNFDFKG